MIFANGPARAGAAFFLAAMQIDPASAASSRKLPAAPSPDNASFYRTGRPVQPISAYTNTFCPKYEAECAYRTNAPVLMPLNARNWQIMNDINRSVNNDIIAVEDASRYSAPDVWDYPENGQGDCEDFALLKRKKLIGAGFDRSSLSITVVLDTRGEGHAVLTVRTDKGDFILDNLNPAIVSPAESPYKPVKMIDPADAGRFIEITGIKPAGNDSLAAKTVTGRQNSANTGLTDIRPDVSVP